MIRVTCAIIRNDDDHILAVQRGPGSDHPYKWEFPGGKVDINESDEDSIIREIREELSMEIILRAKLNPVVYDYGKKVIELVPFVCDTLDETPVLSEHVAWVWSSAQGLAEIDFAEADIIVAANYSENYLANESERILPPGERPAESEKQADPELRDMIARMISLKEVDWIAGSAIDNPLILNKLLDYSYSADRKLAFRSSWTLSKVFDKKPELFGDFLPGIIDSLDSVDNESTLRSFLRIISLSDLSLVDEKRHGYLADRCFDDLRSGFSAIAIKAYSMEILYKLAVIYPELINELSSTIRMIEAEGSAGIVARGTTILRKLANITKKE